MLMDTQRPEWIEQDVHDNWHDSLSAINSRMHGLVEVCGGAADSLSCFGLDCDGAEPTPWDGVVETIKDINDFIKLAYPGL